MNKEYIIIDDKAVIIDEKGNKSIVEYYDNLEKVLKQENVVEELEKELDKSLKRKDRLEAHIENQKYNSFMPLALGAFCSLITPVFTNPNSLQELLQVVAFSGAITIPITGLLSLNEYHDYRLSRKNRNGLISKINYIKNTLEEEKGYLLSINKNGKIKEDIDSSEYQTIGVNNFLSEKVDAKEELKTLKRNIQEYYRIGYNEKLTKEKPKTYRK